MSRSSPPTPAAQERRTFLARSCIFFAFWTFPVELRYTEDLMSRTATNMSVMYLLSLLHSKGYPYAKMECGQQTL